MGKSNRNREQFHTGNRIEIMYKLMSYGIPVDLLPLSEVGCIKTKHISQWIKARRFQEAIDNHRRNNTVQQHNNNNNTTSASPPNLPIVIECPLSTDVVFRNGQSSMSHPGNVMFRGLLETYYEQHRSATTIQEKVAITWKVVDEVLEARHGRFLTWENIGVNSFQDNSTVLEEVQESGVMGWWTPLEDPEKIRVKVATSLRDETKRIQGIRQQQESTGGTYRFLLGSHNNNNVIPRNDLGKRKRGDGPNSFFADEGPSNEDDDAAGISCCNVRRI